MTSHTSHCSITTGWTNSKNHSSLKKKSGILKQTKELCIHGCKEPVDKKLSKSTREPTGRPSNTNISDDHGCHKPGEDLGFKNIRTTKHIKKLRTTLDANGWGHQRVPRASEGPWWQRLRTWTGPNACFRGQGPPTPFWSAWSYSPLYMPHLTTPEPCKAKYQRTTNWICQRSNAVHLFFLKLANM